MTAVIFPSVMAKNQKEVDYLLKKLRGVATKLHLDVADGKCVPTQYMNFDFRLSKRFDYNVHLMIKNPEELIRKNNYKYS